MVEETLVGEEILVGEGISKEVSIRDKLIHLAGLPIRTIFYMFLMLYLYLRRVPLKISGHNHILYFGNSTCRLWALIRVP